MFPKENKQQSLLISLAISLSSGDSNSLMALVPLQHSPADQDTPLYPAARQSILVRLVGKVMAQGLISGGVETESDPCWGGGVSLSNVLVHMTCVSGVLVPCWTNGVWVECSAESL